MNTRIGLFYRAPTATLTVKRKDLAGSKHHSAAVQTRSFCYVDDLIDCMIRFMNTDNEITGPINMGNPGEFTIMELAKKIIELTGSKSTIQTCPLPHDDPKQRKPDITLAESLLGWHPTVLLEDGLKKTIPYFKSLM